MLNSFGFNLAALAALVPAALLPLRRGAARDFVFWLLLAVAVAGPALWSGWLVSAGWHTSLSTDLWVDIAASLVLFSGIAAINPSAWRLTPLLVPYLLVLGLLASLFAYAPGQPLPASLPKGWLDTHILVSVVTLGLLTVAAVAALASFLQARALKSKRPNGLTRMLPAVAESERLFEGLLFFSELVLGLGVATGMATQYAESGDLLLFDHKTLLSLLAFVVIGLLLVGRRVCGVRGQMAARVVLLAYLLVILGFFGVKFVRQVLIG